MPNLLNCPLAFAEPKNLVISSAWLEHIPFAFALVQSHQPRLLVELGTLSGCSYFAFCQAVECLGLPTKCYAVDTWKGDVHVGNYSDEVFNEVSIYHDQHYKAFSNLLRMQFDDACKYFTDNTIDILHIDGCHHYEAVKNDFETWLPKMSERGIVLFHDSFVKERDFGVGIFIEELKSRYPVFDFTHGYGLSIAAVGSRVREEPVWELFQASPEETAAIRRFFASLGSKFTLKSQLLQAQALAEASRQNLHSLQQALQEREQALEKLQDLRHECERTLIDCNQALAESQAQITHLLNSTSWRLTKPLRIMRDFLQRLGLA